MTNLFLYHLQRHSDHHANPTRRYQTLRSMEGAPNLPSGYASMIALTYFPPLWRKVMDQRVLAHYDGDITRVNIHPRVRDKVLAAQRAGISTVILPKENEADLDDLPRDVRKQMTFVLADHVDEVMEAAFPGADVLEFSSAARG